ncbi:MAG: hypothetical protein AAB621_02160 [Patescibacteria group bacterium]
MNSQKGIGVLGIILAVVGILVIGLGSGMGLRYYQDKISKKPDTQTSINQSVACTQEAKICPDGSSVGRTGPNCEFAECLIVNVASSTEQTISTSSIDQNISTSSLILSINAKDTYKVNEYLTGATYKLNYTGTSFDAVILYKQSLTVSGTVPGATMSYTAYDTDFRTINAGGFISDVTVLSPIQTNIEVNGQKGQIVNVFSNEGKYMLTMSVYKCSDIASSGKCPSGNVSVDNILKQTPIKTVSKTITVAGKEEVSIPAGKTVLDCDYKKDPLCGQNFLDLFEANLKSCKPSIGTTPIGMEPLLGIMRSYEILGVEDNLCVINFSLLKIKTAEDVPPAILNKTMNCKYGDLEKTIQNVADIKNCSGPLYDELQKLQGQAQ